MAGIDQVGRGAVKNVGNVGWGTGVNQYKSAKFGLVLTVTYLQIYIYIYIYICMYVVYLSSFDNWYMYRVSIKSNRMDKPSDYCL